MKSVSEKNCDSLLRFFPGTLPLVFGSEIWSSPDRRVVGHFAPSRPAISPAAVRHLAVLSPTNSRPMVCVAPFRSVSPPGPLRTGSRGMDRTTRIGFCRRMLGGAGSPSVVAPRCAATFVRSRFKWTRAFLVPRPRLASLSSIRPIFMTAPCTVNMVTPFGAACLPVVHARKVRSCSPHRQGMAFLCEFFCSLGGGDAAKNAGRLLSAHSGGRRGAGDQHGSTYKGLHGSRFIGTAICSGHFAIFAQVTG